MAPENPRVELTVSARTVLLFLGLCVLVALALFSLGTLFSILLAAVVAVGLDPVVTAMVRRGWKRGHAALAVFAALFVALLALVLVTAGPVSLVTLTFLALFLLMERPTITDWLFGFARPDTEMRSRPVLEESIGAVSSSLIGNIGRSRSSPPSWPASPRPAGRGVSGWHSCARFPKRPRNRVATRQPFQEDDEDGIVPTPRRHRGRAPIQDAREVRIDRR
jgi:hypothetical protein